MSGLLGLLDLGSGAITAQDAGVAISGRNTANVNTEGYSEESVTLSALPGYPVDGGVIANGATRASDDLLSANERQAAADQGSSSATSAATSSLEQAITPTGQDLVQGFASLFGAFGELSASPTDASLRQQVVSNAQAIAASFQQIAQSISQAQSDADKQIAATTKQASQLAAQLSHLNAVMATTSDPTIADQRDLAAKQLSALTGGTARIDPDGMMRFSLTDGQVLVDGTRSATIQTAIDPNNGNHLAVQVVSGGTTTDVTKAMSGGQLAGVIAFRDGTAQQAANSLDQLAYDTATQINAQHSAGAGLDGNSGRNLFTQPGQVAGAAAAFAVDPTVAANPSFVAAAAAGGASGDGSNALALGNLGDQLLAAGGSSTLSDQAINVVDTVGAASQTASNQATLDTSRVSVLASARSSLSGVSTQQELTNLAQYQNASEAASKFVSTVNDLLTDLITNL